MIKCCLEVREISLIWQFERNGMVNRKRIRMLCAFHNKKNKLSDKLKRRLARTKNLIYTLLSNGKTFSNSELMLTYFILKTFLLCWKQMRNVWMHTRTKKRFNMINKALQPKLLNNNSSSGVYFRIQTMHLIYSNGALYYGKL